MLAELLNTDKAAVARRTANLEAKGYLVRQNDPHDGRRQLLYPTGKAEMLKISKVEIESAFYDFLLTSLTEEEATLFASLLDRLYTASKTESRNGFPHLRHKG